MRAKEFRQNYHEDLLLGRNVIDKMLIEFAKFHVELALKSASENAKTDLHRSEYGSVLTEWNEPNVDKNSILNAYPLNNIK